MNSDSRLVSRLRRSRDQAAEFDRRFGLVRTRLERICGSLVGAVDAPDIVHDVYLQARPRIGQLRDPDALEAWLTPDGLWFWVLDPLRFDPAMPVLLKQANGRAAFGSGGGLKADPADVRQPSGCFAIE